MISKFKKSKAMGSVATGSNTASDHGASEIGELAPPSPGFRKSVQKSDVLASIKTEISVILGLEMQPALAEDLDFIKGKLQAVRVDVIISITTLRAEINQVRLNVKEAADGLFLTGQTKWKFCTVP